MPPPKRRRIASSDLSSQHHSDDRANLFSDAVECEITAEATGCFACESTGFTAAAPVIQPHDPTLDLLQEQRLTDFSLSSIENGVALCSQCRDQFSRQDDPGFIFFPSDLQYFIDRELEYRRLKKRGRRIRRWVPTAAQYCEHQKQRGAVAAHARAGLYRRIFLKDYMASQLYQRTGLTSNDLYDYPVHWCGAPFASMKRAFAVLANPRVGRLPLDIERDLALLKNLYYRDDFDPDLPRNPASIFFDPPVLPSAAAIIENGQRHSALQPCTDMSLYITNIRSTHGAGSMPDEPDHKPHLPHNPVNRTPSSEAMSFSDDYDGQTQIRKPGQSADAGTGPEPAVGSAPSSAPPPAPAPGTRPATGIALGSGPGLEREALPARLATTSRNMIVVGQKSGSPLGWALGPDSSSRDAIRRRCGGVA